jgi:nucleoside-diphosphate-sugar epimerase
MLLKNKTILVTGADGFTDSLLTEALVKEGAKTDKIKNDIEILAPTLYNSSGFFAEICTEWHRGLSG